jgi:hypothetical protein
MFAPIVLFSVTFLLEKRKVTQRKSNTIYIGFLFRLLSFFYKKEGKNKMEKGAYTAPQFCYFFSLILADLPTLSRR